MVSTARSFGGAIFNKALLKQKWERQHCRSQRSQQGIDNDKPTPKMAAQYPDAICSRNKGNQRLLFVLGRQEWLNASGNYEITDEEDHQGSQYCTALKNPLHNFVLP